MSWIEENRSSESLVPSKGKSHEVAQIITEKKDFDSAAAKTLKKDLNYDESGFDYHVVSIMGSQSTGKSTVLNYVFGTNFNTMNDVERKQTTKGIWMSHSPRGNIVVLDVEGTDGCERGEDKDFERKSSLFSLTVSEVLIINVWETQIGLYTGSNMSLLRTVLDVNLHLFGIGGPKTKTCLLFLIRDHIGGTPVENLKVSLINRLEELWSDIVKPKKCANTKLDDFFDVEFIGVPHKIYAYSEFVDVVQGISKRFLEKSPSSYIFKHEYARGIPSDGFLSYLERIWNVIKHNEELNLPCQKQLLAKFKCDEVSLVILDEFADMLKNINNVHEKGYMVPDLGKAMDDILKTLLGAFETKTFRYSKDVCDETRKKLEGTILGNLEKCYDTQLEFFTSESISRFSNNIKDLLIQEEKLSEFIRKAKKSLEYEIYLFDNAYKESKPLGAKWDNGEKKEKLINSLDETLEKGLEKKLDDIVSEYCKECVTEVESVFIEELEIRSPNIWHKVFSKFSHKFSQTKKIILDVLEDDLVSSRQIEPAIKKFSFCTFTYLISRIKEEIEDVKLVDRTVDLFINKLMYNEEGISRPFYTKMDVDAAYIKAKVACESYARLLSKIDVSKDELPSEVYKNEDFNPKILILIPAGKLAVLLRHAGYICEGKFMDVKGRVVSNRRGLPLWAIIALVLLGWNEVMTILRNPLYLFICLIIVLTGYLLWCFLYSDSLLNHFFRRFPQVIPKPIIGDVSLATPDEQNKYGNNDAQIDEIDKAFNIQGN